MSRPSRRPAVIALAVLLSACATPAPPPPAPIADTGAVEPSRVVATLLLAGDPGDALPGRSPVLARMAREVRALRRGGRPTTVVWLGDNVYPLGVRPPNHPGHARDTTILHAQLATILDTEGRDLGATAIWIPGNHDWGQAKGDAGVARLGETESLVDAWRRSGLDAVAAPRGGSLAPVPLDPTPSHRLLLLDTQAWLAAAPERLAEAEAGLRRALREAAAEEREVLVLAHHPLRTGGSHGSGRPLTSPLGLLARAGAIVQDVQAAPYRRMIEAIDRAFAGQRPLLWANGHDHNVQLYDRRPADRGAVWELTTGSGSKSQSVVEIDRQILGGPWPSLARVDLLADGGTVLTVLAADVSALECPESPEPERRRCMQEGTASFRVVFRDTLTRRPESRP